MTGLMEAQEKMAWMLWADPDGRAFRFVSLLVYDFVARVRLRPFAKPKEACPLVPPPLRGRFSP